MNHVPGLNEEINLLNHNKEFSNTYLQGTLYIEGELTTRFAVTEVNSIRRQVGWRVRGFVCLSERVLLRQCG